MAMQLIIPFGKRPEGAYAAGRGRRRPVVSKHDVCERKASPVAPVVKSLAYAKLFTLEVLPMAKLHDYIEKRARL